MIRAGVIIGVMLVLMLLTASCSGPFLRRGPCPDPMDRLRERLDVLFDDQ